MSHGDLPERSVGETAQLEQYAADVRGHIERTLHHWLHDGCDDPDACVSDELVHDMLHLAHHRPLRLVALYLETISQLAGLQLQRESSSDRDGTTPG